MKTPDVSTTNKPLSFQVTSEFYEDLDRRIKKTVQEAVSEAFKALKPQKQYMTRRQVAERLHVTLPTTYRLCERGILSPHKVGYRILFDEEQVEQAIHKL